MVPTQLDRFIWIRKSVNFEEYYDQKFLDKDFNSHMSQTELIDKHRKDKAEDVYRQILGIPMSIRHKNECTPSKQSSSALWQCFPRTKPTLKPLHTAASNLLTSNQPLAQMVSMSESGRLVARHEGELVVYEKFQSAPDTVNSYGEAWPICMKHVSEITAIWQHPSGTGVFLACKIWVPPARTLIWQREKCEAMQFASSYSCKCDNVFERFQCHVASIECHDIRPIVYFSCKKHGISSVTSSVGVIQTSFNIAVGERQVYATSLKLSPSGAFLAACFRRNGIGVYNAYNLNLVHHLLPNATVRKAFDWHPWASNLLVAAPWKSPKRGKIYVWKVHLDEPLTETITHPNLTSADIFMLRFHPRTAELVVSTYAQHSTELDDSIGSNYQDGISEILIFNGFGELVDCVELEGLLTQMLFANNDTELIVGLEIDILVRLWYSDADIPRLGRRRVRPPFHLLD